MADSISFDTAKLVQVVPNLKRPSKFLLDTFFPNIVEADTEEVAIDVEIGIRRMAPFVSPLHRGRMVEARPIQTDRFKPAYIKDKRAPDLRRPIRRTIGERIGGDLTAAEREMINLQYEMEDQIDMIDRRLEWMAASVLSTGQVIIVGEGFPATLVDFGRDPRLTIVLTGSSVWGTQLNPEGRDTVIDGQLTSWAALILQLSGASATDIVFTNKAWTLFKNGAGVYGTIQAPVLQNQGNALTVGTQVQRGGVFMGTWGMYRLWLYNEWFVDENDVEQPLLEDGYILISGPNMMGTRAFGMIIDPKFNYQPMAYAPKTWVEEDPAQRLLMMQSSPLVIPSRVNASLAVKVA
jgi:hypothetical protein